MTILYVGNRRPRPSSWDTPAPPDLGIAIYRYAEADAGLDHVGTVAPDISVGAVCIDDRTRVLYCTDEAMTLPGYSKGGGGQVCAFAIDPATGDLAELNRQPSHGSLPSYVAVDPSGRYLIVVNHTGHTPITRSVRDGSGAFRIELQYDDATTVLYRLNADGSIGDACDVHRHEGGGGPLPLQTHSQLHAVERSPSGRLFVVCDKGSDEIALFRIDGDAGRLLPCPGSPHRSVPGSSPRYCVFHPTLPFFYVNHETRPIVSIYRYDEDGNVERVAVADAHPGDDAQGRKPMQSDLRIHPSGRVVYDLLRGVNEVRVFSVDAASGRLDLIQVAPLDGDGPRGCAISPDGRFLLIAALVSRQVLVWAIGSDGTVAPTHRHARQPYPGNLTFLPRVGGRTAGDA